MRTKHALGLGNGTDWTKSMCCCVLALEKQRTLHNAVVVPPFLSLFLPLQCANGLLGLTVAGRRVTYKNGILLPWGQEIPTK